MARGLYMAPRPQQTDYMGRAIQGLQGAGSMYARMEPNRKYRKPGKTVGGGIQSGVGAGLAGMQLQPMIAKSLGLGRNVATPSATAGQAGVSSTPVTIGAAETTGPYAGMLGETTQTIGSAGAGAAGGAAAGAETGAFTGAGVAAGDAALMAGSTGAGATAGGGAAAGASTGATAGSAGGPYGAAIGAGIGLAIGLASYYLS